MIEGQITELMSEEAITWFARLRADDVSIEDRENFAGWMRSERLHQQAFIEVLSLWEGLAVIRSLDFIELEPFSAVWRYRERLREESLATVGT